MSQLFMRRPHLNDLPPVPPLPSGMTLREAGPSDAPGLAALLRSAFEDPSWTVERVRRELLNAPDVKATYVIVTGGVVIATASARLLPESYPDSGYVHWVAALPDFRGKRLGFTVSLAVLHEFVRLGCRDAVLETDDFRLPALKTYLGMGFQPEHRDETHAARWEEVHRKLAAAP